MPPPPLVIVELVDPIPTTTYYKVFMSVKLPNFNDKEGLYKAKEWLKEVEKPSTL